MGHFLHDITSIFIITLIIFGLYISTVLLVDFLYVIVHQTGNPHFAAAFVAEVSLVFHSGTLPSGFTFFFIIVSLPLFFVNNKAADSLPLAETTSGFMSLQNSRTQKIGTRFSASADFVTL